MQLAISNKQILRIAAPISLALVIPQINHMTNTAFVGRLGEFDLAVVGIAGIYYLIMYMIAYGLNSGMQVLIARRAGELNYPGIGKLFSQGFLLSILFSLLGIMITLSLAPAFFSHSLHSKEIYNSAIAFIRIRIWGLPFLMLTGSSNPFYIGSNHSKVLIISSCFQESVNILYDYLLIFGKWGFPDLGLNGAAYASIMAECTGCIVSYFIIYRKGYCKQFGLFASLRPRWETIKSILQVSAPLITQYLFTLGGWMVFFIFIEHLGEEPLAISNMLRSVFGFFGIFTWAFAAACNTMVSNILGQGLQQEVFRVIRKVAVFSLACAAVISLLLNVFPHTLLRIYTTDNTLILHAIPSLIVISFSALISAVAAIVYNGVTGTGDTRVNILIEFIAVSCYLIYCEVIIQKMRMPLPYAWGSEFVYWIIILVLCLIYLKSGRWKKQVL